MAESDIALELARLHILHGADFVRQLKTLVQYNIFKPVDNEKGIFAAEGSHCEDFAMLLDAARKAVAWLSIRCSKRSEEYKQVWLFSHLITTLNCV